MIDLLRDKITRYVTENSNLFNWENVREMYGAYTYLMFLCMATSRVRLVESLDDVVHVAIEYGLERKEILEEVSQLNTADSFAKEILEIIGSDRNFDISRLYQEYLAIDFVVKGNALSFENGKNSRDILGSYYTQEEFAKTITRKAIDDFFSMNPNFDGVLKIVDYSCGGSAFLLAAIKICKQKNIKSEIYGYDVDPIAVVISRFKATEEPVYEEIKTNIILGNPLLPDDGSDYIVKFKNAITGRYYNQNMGISPEKEIDIVLGNPPWEKIRFEGKKFLRHFFPECEVGTKSEREQILKEVSVDNIVYYRTLCNDYDESKKYLKKAILFENSSCGELNTYALFTELSYKMLRKGGVAGLIIKSSLVKMPVYSGFFKKLTYEGNLYDLYMFVNRKKIFSIDSREEFSVIYLSKGIRKKMSVALNLDEYKEFDKSRKTLLSFEELNIINPETGMMPSIKSNEELQFLLEMAKHNDTFGTVYKKCRYGRLVHLTNHSSVIKKEYTDGYKAIYEGKFIEQYTNKFATFGGMKDEEKYKNKTSARMIDNPQGKEYPESRFFIDENAWNNISKNFEDGYVVAWRSLTSATNKRTMLATILPLIPTCQSIQVLQLNDERQMLHVLALFNSIVFDYMIRLKMAGLDLTQTIIKQIPVPQNEKYDMVIEFKNITASVSVHLISRLKKLYEDDRRLDGIFSKYEVYEIADSRKVIISDIDKIIAKLYGVGDGELKDIALSFDAYYTKEEVESLF